MDMVEGLGRAATSSIGPTRALAQFVAGLTLAQIDPVALHAARRHLVDTVGAGLAGASQDLAQLTQRTLLGCAAPGPVKVPGFTQTLGLLDAAYLAGVATHGLELDDGFRAGSLHPGTVVVPVVLTLGAARGASGEDAVRAMVAGYEVSSRIGAATHPRTRWRGFHNTGCAGVFGAAAAAAVLLGFDAAQTENAFGVTASSAGGLFTFLKGGDVKRLHPAHAAREGMLAALLTEQGIAGPPGALEYKDGYFHAYAGETPFDAEPETDIFSLGGPSPASPYTIAGCYMKPYACCRHLHPALDAVLDIVATEDLLSEQIRRIDVGTYAVAASHAGAGWSEMTTAQMSYGFTIATAVLRRRVTLADFGEAERGDARLGAIASKVHVRTDAACDAAYPRHSPACVRIETIGGMVFERTVPEPLGSALNPLSDAAVREKFLGLARIALSPARAAAALEQLWTIGAGHSVAALVDGLCPTAADAS